MNRGMLALLLGLAGCGQESTTPAAQAEAFDLPADQVAYGVRHNLSQDGIRRAVLNSDTAFSYEDSRTFDLFGVRVVFYGDAGESAGTLTSRTGEYDMGSGTFIAREDVVLITEGPDGQRRLLTDELFFDVRADHLWSDRPFTLEEGDRVSHGTTFRSDSKFETWSVQGARTAGPAGEDGGLSF